MNKDELKKILNDHALWVINEEDGERADLRGADLRDAALRGANLRDAALRGADIRDANLQYAALRDAALRDAALRNAALRGADLRDADLRDADLRGADLRGVNLRGADLRDADLRDAALRDADLRDAALRGADLRGADLPNFKITPEQGSFIAYKKVQRKVLKIKIPNQAQRTSCLINRKCRAEYIDVLEVVGEPDFTGVLKSERYGIYQPGQRTYADKFCDDMRIDCSNGIHFFMTLKEAEEW